MKVLKYGFFTLIAVLLSLFLTNEYFNHDNPSVIAPLSSLPESTQNVSNTETNTGYVIVSNTSYLNVRQEPSSDSDILGKLYLNNPVQIVEAAGEWYKIVYLDSFGYVHSSYIKSEPTELVYDDIPENYLTNDNIPNLPVRYLGHLSDRTEAYPLKSNKRACYIPSGTISVISLKGEYAIIAKADTLLRIPIDNFDNIIELNPSPDSEGKAVLGAYTTFFSTSNSNRSNNIMIGADAMRTCITPGNYYSFNEIVGDRTSEKGYLPADAFKGQEVVQAYGGGVCQLSSTLYAAVRHNPYLSVSERYEHSMSVDYIPYGMDATVNYNNRDIKFINNYNFNIYVDTFINKGMLTVIVFKNS